MAIELLPEVIEPEVEREMRTAPLLPPPKFEGRLRGSDAQQLKPEHYATAIAFNVHDQHLSWCEEKILYLNSRVRHNEATIIRQNNRIKKLEDLQKEGNKYLKILRWIIVALSAGLIAGWTRSLF